MGLPKILISFKSKALNLIKRSQRGVVVMLVKDTSKKLPNQNTFVYDNPTQVHESFSDKNKQLIEQAFVGGLKKLLVERVGTTAGTLLADVLKRLETKQFNYIIYPQATPEEYTTLATWIKTQRDDKHRTFKTIVYNTAGDHQGIINYTNQKVVLTNGNEFVGGEFTARLGGILAGLGLERSSTYYPLKDVESIVPIENADQAIDEGQFIIIEREGAFKIARGVTSLVTLAKGQSEEFKKIKIVEGMDLITEDITKAFSDDYVGKVVNNSVNKRLFLDAVNGVYFSELEGSVLSDDYDNVIDIDFEAQRDWAIKQGEKIDEMSESDIKNYPTGSHVFISGSIKFVDAMEDLVINFVI